jgi:type IV secretion system protein VirB11
MEERIVHATGVAMSYAEELPGLLARDLGDEVVGLLTGEGTLEIGRDPHSDRVWIHRSGRPRQRTRHTLSSSRATEFLNRVADAKGQVLTRRRPRLEASLPERIFGGARLTGHIPPIVRAPGLVIRTLPRRAPSLESYVCDGIMSEAERTVLQQSVRERQNIFVVGGTGTGKTTLAMALLRLASQLYPEDRIVTIEDTPELKVDAWCHCQLYTSEHRGLADLIEVALRLSPDRLVVGESRGRGILRLFDAMLTGHPGGISTFHADSARKALRRMMIYCRRASDTGAHQETIAEAVDLIVVLAGRGDARRVHEIAAVDGLTSEGLFRLRALT